MVSRENWYFELVADVCLVICLQLAEVEKQQLLKQQQNQKNSKSVRELERINRVS